MQSPSSTQAGLLQGCCPITSCIQLAPAEPGEPDSKTRSKSSACRHNFVATTTASLFPNTKFLNNESIPSMQESFAHFIKAYPFYSNTVRIDRIRAAEYPHLCLNNHVCLDYIGVGLFSQSQLPSNSSDHPPLFSITYKPVSLKAQLEHGGEGSRIESSIKKRIMDFLNVSSDDYTMVFTANRSAAFKLVAESYPFQMSRRLLTVYDHESEAVETMITAAEKSGSRATAAEFKWPRLRIHSPRLRKTIINKNNNNNNNRKPRGLFVFPLQSRMSGASYSYQWMTLAQQHGWHVLLDASALGPKYMNTFGLSLIRPDFLICSFYKVFGDNPTGFGCLFIKKSIVPLLETSSTAGIVSIIPPKDSLNSPDTPTPNAASDNTQTSKIGNSIDEQEIECRCLDEVDTLGQSVITSRGRYLINWLITAMMKLEHPNRLDCLPLVRIYGPKVKFDRGAALAFNIYDWKGEMVEPALVQKLADRNHVSLSHGFLHHIWYDDSDGNGKGEKRIEVVTAALTFLANFEDVYRLWAFVAQFLDADFVEKERWRYTALNQDTIQV